MADEDRKEKLDRELIELLNELRVAMPGVQVLFAFLLTVPFSTRFADLSGVQRDAFFVAFIATALSTTFLTAPSAYHRLRWRQFDKERMLRTSNRLAIAGIASLAVAVTAVVLVVTDLVFPRAAAVTTAVIGGAIAWLWFGLPLFRRATDEEPTTNDGGGRRGRSR